MSRGGDVSERALILAPAGRDAVVAAQILMEVGTVAQVCDTLDDLLARMIEGAALAVVGEEVLINGDLNALSAWIEDQPSWSDFPFLVLNRRGGSVERNPAARRLSATLGNVSFLERPFHPTTLVSAVDTALRGRRRQYEARERIAEIQRAEALLERRVADRTAQLQAANRELAAQIVEREKAETALRQAQRLEAVGQLTSGVAHDFNNLLTVVIGALDMILRSPDDAARRKKLGEAALAAARRGEGLTHQLLAFSRRQALRPQPVDLNSLVTEGEPLLRRAVGEAIDFKLKLRRGGAEVSVDPAQFEAALLNLLVNARDALTSGIAPGGGSRGRITVQTTHCSVEPGEVRELAGGDYVCITVSDNGPGMDDATLARVFEPFFTTKAVGKGTGLGLSQVYGFARQSGGGVRVVSSPGQGAEIRLYLPPLKPDEKVATKLESDASEAIPGGRRLLLVEDDVGVSAIAVELLAGLGLEVEAVETGPEALQVLAYSHFDVMLSDVVMPGGMTGIELARLCAIRHPDLRILLTSGYAGDDVDEALSDAPWPFLRKPYSGEQLRKALSDLLPLTPATR